MSDIHSNYIGECRPERKTRDLPATTEQIENGRRCIVDPESAETMGTQRRIIYSSAFSSIVNTLFVYSAAMVAISELQIPSKGQLVTDAIGRVIFKTFSALVDYRVDKKPQFPP